MCFVIICIGRDLNLDQIFRDLQKLQFACHMVVTSCVAGSLSNTYQSQLRNELGEKL